MCCRRRSTAVFEPFTLERLQTLLRQRPLTAAGERYVQEALDEPSRNVGGTARNVSSTIPNPKMGFTLQSESRTGERPWILALTYDDDCLGLVTQAPKLSLAYKGRNGRFVRYQYTPDCLVFSWSRGFIAQEWKPSGERGRLADLYPGKYRRREDGSYGSLPIEDALRPLGIAFEVKFDDELSDVGNRNRDFLYTYLQPTAAAEYSSGIPSLLSLFDSRAQVSIGDLIDAGANRDVLYWALANKALFFDIDEYPLATQSWIVQVFRHESTYRAWRLAVRPDGSRPDERHDRISERDLQAGDVLTVDGKRLTVTFVGLTGILARDTEGKSTSLSFSDLQAALLRGCVLLPSSLGKAASPSRLWSASPAALNRAIAHAEVLRKIESGERLALEEQYSSATIRRWKKKVDDGKAKGWSDVESLIDDVDRRGFHGPHINADLSEELDRDIRAGLEDPLCKNGLAIYSSIEAKWRVKGWLMVAKSTFYQHVKKVKSPKQVQASQGHKAAHQITPAFWTLNYNTPPHGEHALSWVHIDSTLLDIEVRSSLSGQVLGRPWLTIAVCAFTRRVVGFYLSFRPPSYVSTMMVLADIIRRTGRAPDGLVHDWGSEFKAKDFKDCCAVLNIENVSRPKGSPRFGTVIERMFGTTTRQLIDNVAGNTKARKNVRSLTPSYDPTKHSGLWLIDLHLGLEEFFFSNYNQRKHPATLESPDARFDASIVTRGARLHRVRKLDDILPVIAPRARGSVRVLDPARGLYVNYRHYSNPALTAYCDRGQSLLVRPVPFDPGIVLTFFKGQWITCRTALLPEVAKAPEVVRRCLFEEWSIEQRLAADDSEDSRRRLHQLTDELNQQALANREYWSDRKFRDLLSPALLPEHTELTGGSERSQAALDRLSQAMEEAMKEAIALPTSGRLVGGAPQ